MIFEARDLACVRGGRTVFAHLDFALAPGEALLLRGPNGSGKSSLLLLLAGLIPRAGGTLLWEGETVDPRAPDWHARFHFVGHADGASRVLTVAENLRFLAGLAGGGDVEAALSAFDLAELADRPVRWLSAGQKRRLALARLLLVPRPLWLLDEPAVGLDAARRRRLEDHIRQHRARGGICVVASHGDVALDDPLVLDFGEAA